MTSMGTQMAGSALGLLGWIGTIVACGAPTWRVSAFIGNNIVTSQVMWEGLWMSCVVQSTGQMQCKVYDSMLALSADLQAARALVVVSLVAGVAGLLAAFAGGKCTNFVQAERAKVRAAVAAGVLLMAAGLLVLVAASWTAAIVIRDFYNPLLVDAQKRELGASLYIGWGAGALLVLGGALLCASCPRKEEEEGERGGAPSVRYLLDGSGGKVDSWGSVTPTKTYI